MIGGTEKHFQNVSRGYTISKTMPNAMIMEKTRDM
jgi:hypothetical protein